MINSLFLILRLSHFWSTETEYRGEICTAAVLVPEHISDFDESSPGTTENAIHNPGEPKNVTTLIFRCHRNCMSSGSEFYVPQCCVDPTLVLLTCPPFKYFFYFSWNEKSI